MKLPNFNTWQVYYMDNDGRKQVVKNNLSYHAAVKLSQQCNNNGLSTEYESI